MLNYTEVKIQVTSSEQKDLLIAALAEAGFEGFQEDMDMLFAFIPENNLSVTDLETITQRYGTGYSVSAIEPKNWNEIWETGFEPVQIGDFCYIRASFHQPKQGFGHEVIITPKMSFGTGHSATTCLMIEALQKIDCNNKSVLDFGTGTGVLAIIAEKMGADKVDAIDIDDMSIVNAAENIVMNHATKITLHQADSIYTQLLYDVVLANINKNILLQNMMAIEKHLSPGGIAVLSGLLKDDQREVIEAAKATGLRYVNMEEKNNWISVTFKSRKD